MPVRVSVIIPVYNSERFLGATLESVKAQTCPNVEVIVVDDGSTDGTRDVVAGFPGVRYHYQENHGPAAARNTGLALTTGEYVAFLDSDDLWHPEMLQRCMDVLQVQSQAGAVHVNWLSIDEQGVLVSDQSGWQPWRGDIFERLLVHIPFNTSSVVWRRGYWDDIGGFDLTPEINDDWINWLRIAGRKCCFEAIETPLVYRRVHKSSLTQSQARRIIQWRFNALERICAEFDLPDSLEDRAYAEVYWIAANVALRNELSDEAIEHFNQAIHRNHELLTLRSTYYAIACRGESFPSEGFDLAAADERIHLFLDSLYSSNSKGSGLVRPENEARSIAMLSLAQMAYGLQPSSTAQARKYLITAFTENPKLLTRRDTLLWGIRILTRRRLTTMIAHVVYGGKS